MKVRVCLADGEYVPETDELPGFCGEYEACVEFGQVTIQDGKVVAISGMQLPLDFNDYDLIYWLETLPAA